MAKKIKYEELTEPVELPANIAASMEKGFKAAAAAEKEVRDEFAKGLQKAYYRKAPISKNKALAKFLVGSTPPVKSTKEFKGGAKPATKTVRAKKIKPGEVESVFAEVPTESKKFSELSTEEKKAMTLSKLRALKSHEENGWYKNRTFAIAPEDNAKYDRSKLPVRKNMRITNSCSNCKHLIRPDCMGGKTGFCGKDVTEKMARPAEFGIPADNLNRLGWRDMLLYAETYKWYPVPLAMVCDDHEISVFRPREIMRAESLTGRKFNTDGSENLTDIPDYSNRLNRSRVDYCFKVCGIEDQVGDEGEPRTLSDLTKPEKRRTSKITKSKKK